MDEDHDGHENDIADAHTELLPLVLADIPFRFAGISATKREMYIGKLPRTSHQLIVYQWPGNRDRWDLLLSFAHPSETHLVVLTVEQPRNALEQRVTRLLRELRVMPRCPFCRLRADQRSGIAFHLSSESPLP